MRLAAFITVLFTAKLLFAAPPPKRLTAVFTLDAQHREFVETETSPLADQLNRWASECRIEPGEPLAKLQCRPAEQTLGSETAGAGTIPATLALFRDLDETIYLAGCPFAEEQSGRGAASQPAESAAGKIEPEDLRNCLDVEAGHTFSTEVEDEVLRIVIRGKQLSFQIFEVRQKPQTISTPYVPTPSRRMPPVGPQTRSERQGLEPQTEPRWEPTELAAASSGAPSQSSSPGIEPAQTSLRTGRVTIQCPSREAVVIIDDAYMGNCPLTTTLVAGPHTLTVRQPGQREQVRQVRVEAGKTLRWRVENE